GAHHQHDAVPVRPHDLNRVLTLTLERTRHDRPELQRQVTRDLHEIHFRTPFRPFPLAGNTRGTLRPHGAPPNVAGSVADRVPVGPRARGARRAVPVRLLTHGDDPAPVVARRLPDLRARLVRPARGAPPHGVRVAHREPLVFRRILPVVPAARLPDVLKPVLREPVALRDLRAPDRLPALRTAELRDDRQIVGAHRFSLPSFPSVTGWRQRPGRHTPGPPVSRSPLALLHARLAAGLRDQLPPARPLLGQDRTAPVRQPQVFELRPLQRAHVDQLQHHVGARVGLRTVPPLHGRDDGRAEPAAQRVADTCVRAVDQEQHKTPGRRKFRHDRFSLSSCPSAIDRLERPGPLPGRSRPPVPDYFLILTPMALQSITPTVPATDRTSR